MPSLILKGVVPVDVNNLLAMPNIVLVLLFAGVGLLLINISYGLFRAARGHLQAGWFTVGLALLACLFITVGTVQSASPTNAASQSAQSARSNAFGGGARSSLATATPVPMNNVGGANN